MKVDGLTKIVFNFEPVENNSTEIKKREDDNSHWDVEKDKILE